MPVARHSVVQPWITAPRVPAITAPTAIADLALWLDASDTATITHVANAVSQWDDKSGNGDHATQGTGSLQPTTNASSQNGLNVIDFNLDYMNVSGLANSATEITQFVMFKRDTDGFHCLTGDTTDTADSAPKGIFWGIDNSPVGLDFLYPGGINSSRSYGSSTYYIGVMQYSDSGDVYSFRHTRLASGDGAATSAPGTPTGNVRIGRDSASFQLVGKIGELARYHRWLTHMEVTQVEDLWLAKWGL